MLRSAPDYGIYADGLVAADPKGFTVVGIGAYERAIRFLHVFVDTFYDVEASGLTFTLVYDWARGDIRVSWHASVMPKSLFATEPLRVDGISVYDYSPSSGKILSHTIDNVSINDVGVRPERIIFESVPFASFPECTALGSAEGSGVSGARGISHHAQHNLPRRSPATARLSTARPATSLSACTDDTTEVLEAFISKNRARASFGLPALSRAEFDEVNEKVNRLSDKRAARNAEMAGGRPASAGMRSMIDNFVRDGEWADTGRVAFPSVSGRKLRMSCASFPPAPSLPVMKDATGPESCESSWDCESPKNCCDLGFAKICCYSGLGAMSEPAAILEPIPVRVTDGYSYPDHFPENRRGPAGY